VLYSDVEEVMKVFFDCYHSNGHYIAFLPLYAKIFSHFNSQVSEFPGNPRLCKLTLIVVEFFLNLSNNRRTEIKSELMKEIEADRMDVWLWINRQFDIVAKGDFYLLIHRSK